ncbi:RING-H2 finger protein ATL78-like [Lycium ferocissimum]|uniref:RING-H2 finger protein ATL78-like n=1 Tax=Lycium ferocissimum TaxID=112874 RepID=UPI0028156607|nr:RING-H2 finger protein ATL78-like [Lycium ferocissimum]
MATTSTLFIQEFMENFHYSRRLLPEATMMPPLAAAGIRHDQIDDDVPIGNNVFDANVIMVILAVLVSALICSLVLNSIIKCAFKCSSLILADSSSDHTNNPSAANRGIKKKALKTFPVITYTTELKHGIDSECVICLSEFEVGEKVKVLPKCNHGFHVKCIDKWLNSHSTCPTCRHCLIKTCQKIVTGSNFSSSNTLSSAAVPEIIIRIEPLQREGVVSNNQD